MTKEEILPKLLGSKNVCEIFKWFVFIIKTNNIIFSISLYMAFCNIDLSGVFFLLILLAISFELLWEIL